MERTEPFTVVLVGRRHPGLENLSLAYLHSALEQEDISSFSIPINTLGDVRRAADGILTSGAKLVGLSIPDTHSAILALALGQMLADRGYRGHITCGGIYATTVRHWLLNRYPWLDSVVRFAGERPLTVLARAVETGATISNIPGLTTRNGDGRCAPVHESPFSIRPHRENLTERLGHNVASILASRGCPGQCAYCGPSALQRMERDEARRLGMQESEIVGQGVGNVRRRDIDDLCEEMLKLRREDDVRHFAFTDEHLLPFDESNALEYLSRLDRGLRRRGLTDIAMGCQLHAGRITPRIARRLTTMGFVRILLGLDIGEGDAGAGLGRVPFGPREARIVDTVNRLGAAVLSNVMLLHPYSTVETVASAVDAMASISSGIVEAGRLIVYEGTLLKDRLDGEGRLFGNPLRWEYEASTPAVQRFARLFFALKLQAFGNVSIGVRTHETMWDVALARRIDLKRDFSTQTEQLTALSTRIVQTYTEAYRRALALAVKDAPEDHGRALVREFTERTGFLSKNLADIEASLSKELPVLTNPKTRYKVFAATLFSFCLSSAATGCHQSTSLETESDFSGSDTSTLADSDATDSTDSEAPSVGDASVDTGPIADSEVDADSDSLQDSDSTPATDSDTATHSDFATDSDSATDSDFETDSETITCDTERTEAEALLIEETVTEDEPCFNGYIDVETGGEISVSTRLYSAGPNFQLQGSGIDSLPTRVEERVQELDLHCENRVWISGDIVPQAESLVDQAAAECGDFTRYDVEIDENGFVTGVAPPSESDADAEETVQCILKVLNGLSFPCLADTSLSYMYLMII